MKNKYYEIVFEGHSKAIFGLLEGFMLASNKKDWNFYFSDKYNIQTETLTEILLDWITLITKLHHVVMSEDFYKEFNKAVKSVKNSKFVNTKYIKHAHEIKDASFIFEAKAYGQKYGIELKAIINNMPDALQLHDYNPMERNDKSAKGNEMYAPEHDYIFEAEGRVSGDIKDLIAFRELLDEHPLVEVEKIKLKF